MSLHVIMTPRMSSGGCGLTRQLLPITLFLIKQRFSGTVDNKFPRCTNCVQANKDCTFIRRFHLLKLAKDMSMIWKSERLRLKCICASLIANVTDAVEEEEEAHLIATYRKDFEKWTSFYAKSSGHAIPMLEILLDMKGEADAVKQKEAFVKHRLRTEFWNPRPWETLRIHQRPVYEFPPDDLMVSLIQLYFAHSNIFLPLLHRPTFERKIAEGEHLDVNSTFGTVVMLVMAIASRFSDDPRVLAPGHDSPLSSGWKWFAPFV
ncbi:hypothetical protein C8J56DRAFT_1023530 [Mycena floridula]|nr:hypothetical protein C8J56DRAFT_1023530 [Mycena floridula]